MTAPMRRATARLCVSRHSNVSSTKVYLAVAIVAATVLAMPVTSCAAERNWTIWGQVYIKNRSSLGLQRAQDLIFVKANDTVAKAKPQTVDDLVVVLDTMQLFLALDVLTLGRITIHLFLV